MFSDSLDNHLLFFLARRNQNPAELKNKIRFSQRIEIHLAQMQRAVKAPWLLIGFLAEAKWNAKKLYSRVIISYGICLW